MTDDGGRDPWIGSLFNNDRIDVLLACGGMGAVYQLRDATLPNIRKVLKVILPGRAGPGVQHESDLQLATHRRRAPTHAACCAGRVQRQDRGVNRVETSTSPVMVSR